MKRITTLLTGAATLTVVALGAQAETKVAHVPGGPHPFFADWEPASIAAKEDFNLGAADYKFPQKWELNLQNDLLESLVTQGYNAFAIHPGDPVGSVPTLNELVGTGAPVIAVSACVNDPSDVSFCLASDAGASAYTGTKHLIEAMGPGTRKIAHFTGWLVEPNTQLRIDGVAKAAAEAGVEIVQVIADIDAPEPAEEKIGAYLAAHGSEIDGVITTAWVPAVVASNAMRRIGDKRIKMVAIDHDEVVMNAIRDGFVVGSMLQNPYGQAYVAAFAADKLLNGCEVSADAPFTSHPLTERFIDSGAPYVDASNVDTRADVDRAMTEELIRKVEADFLSCN
ncbi:sugar ABC transporter substrate-binding protein [Shimia sp. Alg240-R146]|uniref:sugar ABC transporter substrate-binding protein n=1 Tax=Shimia sp. Alg240-R146 TaxID=2993449 RepID=UPI0022E4F2FF|nr:sugar ABC transporter substrate-binding protein [Shimia sp. Alg240-R146]